MSCSLCVRVRVCLFLLNWNFKWSKMNCNWSCKYKYWSRRSVVVVCGSDTQEKRVRKRTRTIQGGFNQNQLRTLYNFAKQSRTAANEWAIVNAAISHTTHTTNAECNTSPSTLCECECQWLQWKWIQKHRSLSLFRISWLLLLLPCGPFVEPHARVASAYVKASVCLYVKCRSP